MVGRVVTCDALFVLRCQAGIRGDVDIDEAIITLTLESRLHEASFDEGLAVLAFSQYLMGNRRALW
jgi:hypothetical protein